MESDSDTCLPSENRVLMAAVRPQLADSFTGMGGWAIYIPTSNARGFPFLETVLENIKSRHILSVRLT